MSDPLDSFSSESSWDAPIPAQSVSLAELQSSRVPIEWHEAIAIIQELCGAILESGDQVGPAALGAGQVLIDSSGKVSSTARGPKDARTCVQQLGELLRATLPEGQFPTQLRLVVSQAISAPPLYSSIREFSQALAYFERPNRTAIIQAVYERSKTRPAHPAAAAVQGTPRTKMRESNTASGAHRGRTRITAVVAAALIVAALASVGAWMLFRPRTSVASSVSNTVRNAGDTALKTATTAVGAVLDRILPRPKEEPAAPPGSATAVAPPAPRRSTRTPAAAPTPGRVTAFDLETSSGASASTPPPPSIPQPSVDGSGVPPAGAARNGNDIAVDRIIYTASDDDVVPPVAVYPQLPTALPAGVRMADLAIIELLVTESGNVGSVRVREAPKTMSDTMFVTVNLSAAKTWRFSPALKDGQPVKYRKAVWILTH